MRCKTVLPPWFRPSVRDGGANLIYNRLIYVPARCSYTGNELSQCINQQGDDNPVYTLEGTALPIPWGARRAASAGVGTVQHRYAPFSVTHRLRFPRYSRYAVSVLHRCYRVFKACFTHAVLLRTRCYYARGVITCFTQPARCPLYSRALE